MDVKKVISELQNKYPGKTIVVNTPDNPTEVICEIDPTSEHPDYSVAIAVIDESVEHFHRTTTEIYEILKGTLKIVKDGNVHIMREGESFVIRPGEKHKAEGHETWFKVTSEPGWSDKDHYVVKTK